MQELKNPDNMEDKEEKLQNIVLQAIMKNNNCDFKSAVRFAQMNYTVYAVAMEAVRIAEKKFST